MQPLLCFLSLLLPLIVQCSGIPNARAERGKIAAATHVKSGLSKASNTTTPGKLRYTQNSGVCETTPNVEQASGYGDLTAIDSIWFWYFAARNNPDTAPLTIWFNGGPGSSSMVGLFQEHGPCRITNDSSTVFLNPWSWNNESNIVYIDQPIGTGFSHGNISRVGTSQQAAADIWNFMQIFLSDPNFTKFQNRELALWAESYGGHFGPTFAAHFLDQNAAIANGTLSGIPLNLQVLAIGNPLTDPLSQYAGYAEYATQNPYRPLASETLVTNVNSEWNKTGGCQDKISACYSDQSNTTACSSAQGFCNNLIFNVFGEEVNFDEFFVPELNTSSYPPNFTNYLNSVSDQIGTDTVARPFVANNNAVHNEFADTGDWMTNSAPDLERIINSGIRTLIYEGDADFVFNYAGVEAMVDNLNTMVSTEFQAQQFADYIVAGETTGQFKQAGNFTYIRMFGAGHKVAAYKFGNLDYGQAAAQMFRDVTLGLSVQTSSTTSIPASPVPTSTHRSSATHVQAQTPFLSVVFAGLLSTVLCIFG